MPAIPPLTILGTIEKLFCCGLVDTSATSELPAIVTEGRLSVVEAADMPEE